MTHFEADIAILMPKITDLERHTERYGGLVDAIGDLSLRSFFAPSHPSFMPESSSFSEVYDINHNLLGDTGYAPVIRDLTMAAAIRPLYSDKSGLVIVHDPRLNPYLASKANMFSAAPEIHPITIEAGADLIAEALDKIPGDRIVVKPVEGMRSQGVHVATKKEVASTAHASGNYLVQEHIDTSVGIPELGVVGVHNIRSISVGSKIVGSIARVGGTEEHMLKGDIYGRFIANDELPESMHLIADAVHRVLAKQPGKGQNIIAIDMMRGLNAYGDLVDFVCEVNRRPQRINRYDMHNSRNLDPAGLVEIGNLWDKAEAQLLANSLNK